MPFAEKFKKTMGFPKAGYLVGGFMIEQVEAGHVGVGSGRYEYPIRIIVQGKGGRQGVRNAFRELFTARRTTFSGYGNPYQLWIGKMEVASLGESLYELIARGAGVKRLSMRK